MTTFKVMVIKTKFIVAKCEQQLLILSPGRTQERLTVGLKVNTDITRTEVYVDDIKEERAHRNLNAHDFITRRRGEI